MNVHRHSNVRMIPFFFNDTATTEIYTLSLHDALPISPQRVRPWPLSSRPFFSLSALARQRPRLSAMRLTDSTGSRRDRKSTRLNSSHANISYAVFCLKKKKDSFMSHVMQCHAQHPHIF